MGGRIHYVGRKDVKDLPTVEDETIQVPMSKAQKKAFTKALSQEDPAIQRSILQKVLPGSGKEMLSVLAAIRRAREVSNAMHKADPKMTLQDSAISTPKIARTLTDAEAHLKETPDGQVVMFTNLVSGGLDVLTAGLEKKGVPFTVFTSKQSKQWGDRDENVKKFLAGEAKVIVVTPAGVEGLNLNKATMFQMVDSHFNPEKNEQAVARAVRSDSLSHREKDKRVVKVRRYQSTVPKSFWQKATLQKRQGGTDEWIQGVADRKQRLNKQLRAVADGSYKEPGQPQSFLARMFL
jgi:SNF2 family DNA or RNA helicase